MRSQGHSPTFGGLTVSILTVSILALVLISAAAGKAKPEAGPTAENAMAAEEALARAFRNNDADASRAANRETRGIQPRAAGVSGVRSRWLSATNAGIASLSCSQLAAKE